jgi:TRAP transporter TAXI family solute receptor
MHCHVAVILPGLAGIKLRMLINTVKQYSFLIIISIGMTLAILLSPTQTPDSTEEVNLSVARFGTSSVGSTFYIIANGFGNLMQNHAGINMTVEPIGGSYANIFSLDAGKLDYAITNSGAAFDGYNGVEPFDGPTDIGLIAQGQASYRFMIVRRDENISQPQDLNGKILIGMRPALPELNSISTALVNAAGLDEVNVVSTKNTKESIKHIKSGTVDGTIIPGGARVPAVVQLFRDGVVDPLYIPDDVFAEMKNRVPPYMFTETFPPGHFQGQEKEFSVFGLNTYIVAGPNAHEEQVYVLTRTLFDNLLEFGTYHNEARKWTIENTLTDPKIPFHPGAIRYFKEHGYWTQELEHIQRDLQRNRGI